MLPSAPSEQAEQDISREHEWPPAFVLANVNVFVVTRTIEAVTIPSQDHMSQAHGGSTDEEASLKKEPRESTVHFDYASLTAHTTARYEGEWDETQSQQCIGKGPGIFQDSDQKPDHDMTPCLCD